MTTVLTPASTDPSGHGVAQSRGLFDREILKEALKGSVRKMNARVQVRNPVMFVVLVGSIITLLESFAHPSTFTWSITVWLFLTVLFANFAEAVAEGRGKAQANALKSARSQTKAKKITGDSSKLVDATELRKGDVVRVAAGEFIPGDGEIVDGMASVDESAVTGESAPVIRESGGDKSSVTGGTRVLSDRIKIRIMANPGETFLDRMISLVEGAKRQKTPNEIALTILLVGLTIIFLFVVATMNLMPFIRGWKYLLPSWSRYWFASSRPPLAVS